MPLLPVLILWKALYDFRFECGTALCYTGCPWESSTPLQQPFTWLWSRGPVRLLGEDTTHAPRPHVNLALCLPGCPPSGLHSTLAQLRQGSLLEAVPPLVSTGPFIHLAFLSALLRLEGP